MIDTDSKAYNSPQRFLQGLLTRSDMTLPRKPMQSQGDIQNPKRGGITANASNYKIVKPKTNQPKAQAIIGSFKKGGKIKKTGNYKLHKGEVVIPKKHVKKLKTGMQLLNSAMKKFKN